MRLNIASKLLLITISIVLIVVLVISTLSGIIASNALEKAAFERLTAVRELKAHQIENYFKLISNEIRLLSKDPIVIDAINQFSDSTDQSSYQIEELAKELKPKIQSYYKEHFNRDFKPSEISQLIPTDPVALVLQNSYILESKNKVQTSSELFSFQDYYSMVHGQMDDFFQEVMSSYGHKDLFLIEKNKGRIIYSVSKRIDFATSLFEGPHSESNLAKIFKLALELPKDGFVIADFQEYVPDFGRQNAFIATPVFFGEDVTGVVVFKIGVEKINSIMTSMESWKEVGLGESGEVYLVANDYKLRNQSRFLIEDRENYLKMIEGVGISKETIELIEESNNSIGLQEVKTVGTEAALLGKSGEEIFPDYRGVEVLSSYRPLSLPGLNWVIMSEIDRSEAFRASDKLIDYLIILASIVLALSVFAAYLFSLSITKPLNALSNSASMLAEGNLKSAITLRTKDEIGKLAEHFDAMRLKLKESFDELETKVSERTAEANATTLQLNQALSNVPVGILMLDENLNFVINNSRYTELLEIPANLTEKGKPFEDVILYNAKHGLYGEGDEKEIVQNRINQIKSHETYTTTITTSTGKSIELNHTKMSDGRLVMIANDITALKEKEEHLKSQNLELQNIQNDLKESEQKIGKIIQSSPDAIITINRKGIIDLFSKSAEEIFGYYKEEVEGKNIKILMPKSIALEHDYYLEKYIPGSESTIVGTKRIVEGLRKDGSTFPCELSVEEVWLGEEMLFIGLVRDITKRIKLENQLKENAVFQESLINAVPNQMFVIDRECKFTAFNDAFEKAFGLKKEDYLGKTVLDMKFMPLAERKKHFQRDQELIARGGEEREEITLEFANGMEHSCILIRRNFDLHGKESGGLLSLLIDITELRDMEREIIRARERAEQANQAKSAFLANMSHELRTPMNAIIGYSEMLAEEAEDEGLEDMLSDLNKITAAGKHLLSLINDVLDLSKIEAGKMDLFLETFSIGDMVSDVANTASNLVAKNNNEFVLVISDDIGEMHADLTKVRQNLFNLISNAAKFTKEGTIKLDVSREVIDNVQWIKLAVSDSGIGIPEDKLGHVFKEFSQADESTTRDFGGTGLGLSLVKRFCEMMGGSIEVESKVNVGSTFTIRLPAIVEEVESSRGIEVEAEVKLEDAKEISTKVSKELDMGHGIESKHDREILKLTPDEKIVDQKEITTKDKIKNQNRPLVLVIDDEQNARDLLARYIDSQGCNVITAKNGSEGLALALAKHPNLITLDVMMPGMDGWEVLKRLKEKDSTVDIPVVMISMVSDKNLSYSLGAIDAIQKPVDKRRLKHLLQRYADVSDKSALVVEDDPVSRRMLKKLLKNEGWTVQEADNGQIGIQKCKEFQFELILLDLMMPIMDGFEFLDHMRQNKYPSSRSSGVGVTAKDLEVKDRARLNKNASQIISKSDQGLDAALDEIHKALASYHVNSKK
jgi:PAS domain S-box-containing protein